MANRYNTTIYAVDPRGLAAFEFDLEPQNIEPERRSRVSRQRRWTRCGPWHETDGRAIVNRNDLALGMKQIVRDSSAYYLLGYNTTQNAADGKFHEIKVNVKRPNIQVRARKGYLALTAT